MGTKEISNYELLDKLRREDSPTYAIVDVIVEDINAGRIIYVEDIQKVLGNRALSESDIRPIEEAIFNNGDGNRLILDYLRQRGKIAYSNRPSREETESQIEEILGSLREQLN